MDDTEPDITNLFLQLGLEAGEHDIARFIRTHQLPVDVAVAEASYWSKGQRQFIAEQLRADAAWAMVVDRLNESLHEDAVKAQTGL